MINKIKKESLPYYQNLIPIVLGFLFLFIIIKGKHTGWDLSIWFKAYWIAMLSFVIGFIGFAIPSVGIHIIHFFELIKTIIGKTLNFILLTIVFYLILTPIALLSRLFGKKKSALDNTTYFIERKKSFLKTDLEKPW